MATLGEIRTKVDNVLADLWVNKIVPKEEAFFALHGRYAQVLISPTTIPEDDATGEFTYRPPSDEGWAPDFTFSIATPVPAAFEIHTHGGPGGHGFTAHVYVTVLGKTYHRAKAYGVGGEDVAWHEVTEQSF